MGFQKTRGMPVGRKYTPFPQNFWGGRETSGHRKPGCKNSEDPHRAAGDGKIRGILKVADMDGGKLMIMNQGAGDGILRRQANLRELARPSVEQSHSLAAESPDRLGSGVAQPSIRMGRKPSPMMSLEGADMIKAAGSHSFTTFLKIGNWFSGMAHMMTRRTPPV